MCAGLGCSAAPQSGGLLYSPAFLEVSDNLAFRGGHESSRGTNGSRGLSLRVFSWGSQLPAVSFLPLQNDIPCIFVQGFFGEAEGCEAHWLRMITMGRSLPTCEGCALHLMEQSPGSPCRSRLPFPVSNVLKRLVQLNNSPPSGSSNQQIEFYLYFGVKRTSKVSTVGAQSGEHTSPVAPALLSSAQKETALSCLAQVKWVSLMPQSCSPLFPLFLVLQ